MLLATLGDQWSLAEIGEAADLLAGSEGQFPSGIRRLPAELVNAVQRERVLAGMLRATAELGYREVSVQDVLDRAGVSRPTFYEHFENKEDCFLAAFDGAAGRLRERLEARGPTPARTGASASVSPSTSCCASSPRSPTRRSPRDRRRACSLPNALRRRDDLLDHFAACLDDQVRAESPAGDEAPSPIAAAGIVGGIEALLYARLNNGETEESRSAAALADVLRGAPLRGARGGQRGAGAAVR